MSKLFDLVTAQMAFDFAVSEWRKDLQHNPSLNGNARIQLKRKIESLKRQSVEIDKLIEEEIQNG